MFRIRALFTVLLIGALVTGVWAEPLVSEGRFHVLRLGPEADLRQELQEYVKRTGLSAVAVVTCVGSLKQAALRFADQPSGEILDGPWEILSLVGCGGSGGWHLHLSVGDHTGRVLGGHLLDGSRIYTTAEIVLVELPTLDFPRQPDPRTGYPELAPVRPSKRELP